MGCNCEGFKKGLSRDVGGIPINLVPEYSGIFPNIQKYSRIYRIKNLKQYCIKASPSH